jgi:divalent metal cation (Fe/Co/Zn/Cd) transporter
LSVSIILVGGAIGIGLHSYHVRLLSTPLTPSEGEEMLTDSYYYKHYYPTWNHYRPERHWLNWQITYLTASHSHSHSHSPADTTEVAHAILNPHAAWFALASVIIKEWLYRLTARVATEEHSPVLKANALQ